MALITQQHPGVATINSDTLYYADVNNSPWVCQNKGGPKITLLKNIQMTHLFGLNIWLLFPRSNNETETLVRFFQKIAIQGSDELTQKSFLKPNGYFARLRSEESLEMWLEHRTALGQVASIYSNYIHKPFELESRLSQDLLLKAAQEAKTLLTNPYTTPSWRELADATGGTLHIISATSDCFKAVFRKIFNDILSKGERKTPVDIAFVVDTTEMMRPHFSLLKETLSETIKKSQPEEAGARFSIAKVTTHTLIPSEFSQGRKNPLQAVNNLEISQGAKGPADIFFGLKEIQKNQEPVYWNSEAIHAVIAICSRPSLAYDVTLEKGEALVQVYKKSKTLMYMMLPVLDETHDEL
jgi:hypothetical protein